MTEDEVLAALRIVHTRQREAVTVTELAWVCAAEIEWAHHDDPGTRSPSTQPSATWPLLQHRLIALDRRAWPRSRAKSVTLTRPADRDQSARARTTPG